MPYAEHRKCTIEGCGNKLRSKIHCGKHHARFLKYGEAEPETHWAHGLSIQERLERGSHVNEKGCRVWDRVKDQKGYGQLGVDGQNRRVHILQWILAHGPIPEGMVVNHECGNTSCLELTHLELATKAKNSQYRVKLASNNTSGYRGVYWSQDKRAWIACAKTGGKNYTAGQYASAEEANDAAIALRARLGFKEFAEWKEENA